VKNLNDVPIIINQYFCMRILTLDNNQPCFPTTPVNILIYNYKNDFYFILIYRITINGHI